MNKILKFLAYVVLITMATVVFITEVIIKLLLLPIGMGGFLIIFVFWPIFQIIKRPKVVDFFTDYVFTTRQKVIKIINYYNDLIKDM